MSYVVKSVTSNQYKVKVVNQNGSLLIAPATVPTVVTAAISDISKYSNTEVMLANDATTYANAIAYVTNNYTSANSLTISSLTDVVTLSLSNNSTLVYNTANDKYVVKQMDLDGGNF